MLFGNNQPEILRTIEAEVGTESIDKAATILADKAIEDRLINVIGPGGHSNMGVEEVFCVLAAWRRSTAYWMQVQTLSMGQNVPILLNARRAMQEQYLMHIVWGKEMYWL